MLQFLALINALLSNFIMMTEIRIALVIFEVAVREANDFVTHQSALFYDENIRNPKAWISRLCYLNALVSHQRYQFPPRTSSLQHSVTKHHLLISKA